MSGPVSSTRHQDEDRSPGMLVIVPKPTSAPITNTVNAVRAIDNSVEADSSSMPDPEPVADPPPPYPSRERRPRGERRAARQRIVAQLQESGVLAVTTAPTSSQIGQLHALLAPSEPSVFSQAELSPLSAGGDGPGSTEVTPLLPSARRRPRTLSHSTALSSHSIAHTVLSLFQQDDGDDGIGPDNMLAGYGDELRGDCANVSKISMLGRKLKRYFRPLWRASYYRPLVHLLLVNFPYALVAFVYLFVGTLTGTTLLIALPLGAVLCWFNLFGARAFARGEIALQTYFHSPLMMQAPNPPYPIFDRSYFIPPILEEGREARPSKPSFLRNTITMFTDQTSYQALFYFLVIKPSITLFLTLAFAVSVPLAFVLVLPAPAVLRALKRIGIWQANIALEGLLQPRL